MASQVLINIGAYKMQSRHNQGNGFLKHSIEKFWKAMNPVDHYFKICCSLVVNSHNSSITYDHQKKEIWSHLTYNL